MSNASVVITGKRIINDPNFLIDLLKLAPARVIVNLQEPHDLRAIEILSRKQTAALLDTSAIFDPMLRLFSTEAVNLASMAFQTLSVLATNQLYLIFGAEKETSEFREYMQVFLNDLREKLGPEKHLCIHVCAAASSFNEQSSNPVTCLEMVNRSKSFSRIGIMISDSPTSLAILNENHFMSFLQETKTLELFLMKVKAGRWDPEILTALRALNKSLVFWTVESFVDETMSDKKYPANVIFLATPNADRISIWSGMGNDKHSLRKVSKGQAEEWLVETFHLAGVHWGRLYDGGYIDLKYFVVDKI